MLLSRAGLRVLLLDRAPAGGDTVSTHALMRGGVFLLQRWGLLDAVVAVGTPPVRRTVFHYGDLDRSESVPVSIRPTAGVEALYAPRRTLLDPLLIDAAAAAGATVRFETVVTGLLRDDAGRVVGVTTRDRRGRSGREHAALVVGADEVRSVVAASVGADLLWQGQSVSSYLYGYWEGLEADGYQWFFAPGMTAGTIPTNDGLTALFLGAPTHRLRALLRSGDADDTVRLLAERLTLGPRLAPRRRGRMRFVEGGPAYLRRSQGPGWALVGDAGLWTDPLSIHGITSALRDADLLCRAVLAAPTSGPAQTHALLEYQRARDDMSVPLLDIVEDITSYEWDLSRIRQLVRAAASAMAGEFELLAALPAAA
jgi:flavin-dependent dehydrogenase